MHFSRPLAMVVPLSVLFLLFITACQFIPTPEPTALPPLPQATLLPETSTLAPVPAATAENTSAGPTPSATASPSPVATQTPAPSATGTITGSAAITGTTAAGGTPAPCFGSLAGQVIADLNGNKQADADEPGVMGATLFLRNAGGIVALYTTGSGQFNFPGLVAGAYTLGVTAPAGYLDGEPSAVDLTVACGATATQNLLVLPANATVTPTPTATTPPPTARPQTFVDPGPRSNAAGFTPFSTGPVYYLSGCGSINSPGVYQVTNGLSSQWDCLQVFSDNVVVDCQGNSLNGIDGNGYGIVVHHTSPILGRPVRNLEIHNCRMSNHKYGIFVDAADNLSIHDNNTSGNYTDTDKRTYGIFLGLVEGGGIRVNDTRGGLVSNNRTDGPQAIGIDIRTSTGVIVSGNTANANTAWGIQLYGVTNSEVSGNTSSNNLRWCTWGGGTVGAGCDAGGIMLQGGSSNNVVKNNIISGSNGNGIFIKAHGEPCGDSNTIANNRIVGALYNSIELSFCKNNRIQGNEISNSQDGIWLGFAVNSEIDAGNYLHDLSNHGMISWNSQDNNISTNRIVNANEGLYFYSADYPKDQFYFVPGQPSDHTSRGNCLCDNTVSNNATAGIHLNNSTKNQITGNRFAANGTNFKMEGNTGGNIIQDNISQGGTTRDGVGPELASFSAGGPAALRVYDSQGRLLSPPALARALSDAPGDSFDLAWFKYKFRASLGLELNPSPAPLAGLWNLLALFRM